LKYAIKKYVMIGCSKRTLCISNLSRSNTRPDNIRVKGRQVWINILAAKKLLRHVKSRGLLRRHHFPAFHE
jgi:hypothetical protein